MSFKCGKLFVYFVDFMFVECIEKVKEFGLFGFCVK